MRTAPIFYPVLAQASPQWQQPAEQLRQVLAQLAPQERRRILDFIAAPPEPPKPKPYPIGDCMRAAGMVADLLHAHPSWPQARARATVARVLGVSTVQLRRMLRHVNQ
ncbi:hypothetical protein [Hymenobacter sp. AT01-02]|uniref:hypothetical protein n=1 Tax=Hymenobacter sp. AT01-02 TaxID=1571877 RepID=UPI0005F1ACF1|nr:hypothetical protein [Hymenobacter sp. AT01-02]